MWHRVRCWPETSVVVVVAGTKKAWHNYGFDRHVLFNHGVDAVGFSADTMHMARLLDTSRDRAEPSE
jgi:hypothetical protein